MTAVTLGQQVANRLNGLGFRPPDDPKMRNVIIDKMVDGYVLVVRKSGEHYWDVGVFHPDIMWRQVLCDLGIDA